MGGPALSLRHRLHRLLAPVIYGEGFAAMTPRMNETWPERQFQRRLLRRLGVDCVFDVGANVGQYAIELRNLGYDGLIFSFEPDPRPFATLEARAAADPKWHVFNRALGREAGSATFNLMTISLFNSFRTPSAADTALYAAPNSVERQVEVPVATLAEELAVLQARHGFARPFLKMDTQGFDAEVFAGAAPVHGRLVAIQSEISVKKLYDGVPDWREQIARYEAAGFELAGLYAVNPRMDELIEFDCYMVRVA